ncbi:protein SAWADEE HOMEODOMAIN HOMOLOG 1-like [Mercurialis annua]|uniref:protein SAWADEE HOMEODOMAIN HOMOLOG 1-like n=1 Tax=Mercurialis annua TaxID=3986 RepID=UPI002160CCEC|nr:protein SAWADEE HOMEODOMAIN HOMOLOG 1-like [Mercurialis annua]
MDRLRPRHRQVFSGFTKPEIEKMEQLQKESSSPMNKEFFQKIARSFNYSSGRAGKPIVRWTEVECWFQDRQKYGPCLKNILSNEGKESSQIPKEAGIKASNLSEMEFEARSSKDGAWYDVEMFLCHRYLPSGEAEVLVRFVGFGAEEDEWINIKSGVRERSIPLENSECHKVQVGDVLCCFQERRDQAIYYDAHVIEIQRKMHDIRGCRCMFLIRYQHDNTDERVRLRRLCSRPSY